MQFIHLTTARSCRTCPHRNRARGDGISHARWSSGRHQICPGRGQWRKVKPWHRGRIKVPMFTTRSACAFVRRFDLADAAVPGGGAHACGVPGEAEERGRERAGVLGRRLGAGVRRAGRGAGVADERREVRWRVGVDHRAREAWAAAERNRHRTPVQWRREGGWHPQQPANPIPYYI
jgi:hypothetical protein